MIYISSMDVNKRRRGGGPRALASAVASITKSIFGKRGFAEGAILSDWESIVGPQLAAHSLPEKISFPRGERQDGVLCLVVDSGSLAVELQHLEPLLIERINGFFGYLAVGRVRIVQGTIEAAKAKPSLADNPRPLDAALLDEAREKELARLLLDVKDQKLRLSLEKLGRAIMQGAAK